MALDQNFTKELESLLNRYGVDAAVGTPDFILAELIVENLQALGDAVAKRERWYGRQVGIGVAVDESLPPKTAKMVGADGKTVEIIDLDNAVYEGDD